MRKLFLCDIVDFTYEPQFKNTISPKFEIIHEVEYWNDMPIYSKYLKHEVEWELDNRWDKQNRGCVYFLLKNDEVVYIGQTKDKCRIRRHAKKGIIDYDSFRFMPTKNDMHIIIERNLLNNYVTKYNKTGISVVYNPRMNHKSKMF